MPDVSDQSPPPLDPLTEEALGWLVRLHSGDETAADWAAYETWKACAADRQAAALRAEAMWETLGPALARKRGGGAALPVIVIAALALPILAFLSGLFGPPASFWADYRAGLGEMRAVTLSDGSVVDLDTGTSFDFDREGGTRVLTLYSGQIFVAVHPDMRRPFIVKTGNGAIRALGTAFDVRRDSDRTTVVVAESTVRVSLPAQATVDVHAGQKVVYSPKGLGAPELAEVQVLTAWRERKIVFKDQPLGELITELSRYRRGTILVLDDDLKRLPVTGVFDTDDDDALFDAIAAVTPVKITRLPLLTIVQRAALH